MLFSITPRDTVITVQVESLNIAELQVGVPLVAKLILDRLLPSEQVWPWHDTLWRLAKPLAGINFNSILCICNGHFGQMANKGGSS